MNGRFLPGKNRIDICIARNIIMTTIEAQTDCVVSDLRFKDGDTVCGGDEIIIVEVMKMMLPVVTTDGGVIKYKCKRYDYVVAGQVLAEVI